MLGSGFNPQLVPNPNAAGVPQQQQPSDSMQPIGGLPNPEHSRMWMQLQQQINQQRTASSGDIVGSQVTLNLFLVTSLSLFHFSLPPFLPSLVPHTPFAAMRPSSFFLLVQHRLRPVACLVLLTSAVAFVTFLLPMPHPLPTAVFEQLTNSVPSDA